MDTINVSFWILKQLLKLTATNLNVSMTSAYKILPHPDKYLLKLASSTPSSLPQIVQ